MRQKQAYCAIRKGRHIDDSGGSDGSTSSSRPPTHAEGIRRHPLSRDLIVTTAIAMADRDGVAALTMRGLGHRLGVEAMTLYRHVNGREDLLEGMTSRLVAQVRSDPDGPAGPQDGWQSYLQWFAHGVRDVAIAHPLLFPLITTRHPAASWLRPPLRSVAIVEECLNALTARGLTDVQAVGVYRSFTSFLLGHLLLETASLGAPHLTGRGTT